ncbi:hypothetical protein CCAX7_62050 [Capsulimonas corticalis]|uniref:Uncharacterized protein n=1 Tax=Capsulimonas corticalis TaxID=2219043 RepID=A0A402CWE2_9BACT|nr:hypothetical protein [Capsulimonas corticalis]BDI34154.1 hypothetical protein CCAX7_62050 [Capsulimonas corticalis]
MSLPKINPGYRPLIAGAVFYGILIAYGWYGLGPSGSLPYAGEVESFISGSSLIVWPLICLFSLQIFSMQKDSEGTKGRRNVEGMLLFLLAMGLLLALGLSLLLGE